MIEKINLAGYCRISVDEELDRENTSIENQKAIIADFAARRFPDFALTFYEDRDRSGYSFEQCEGYRAMRRVLILHVKDILIVKDFPVFPAATAEGWWSWRICATRAQDHFPRGQRRFSERRLAENILSKVCKLYLYFTFFNLRTYCMLSPLTFCWFTSEQSIWHRRLLLILLWIHANVQEMFKYDIVSSIDLWKVSEVAGSMWYENAGF